MAVGPNPKALPNTIWRMEDTSTPKLAAESGYVSPNLDVIYGCKSGGSFLCTEEKNDVARRSCLYALLLALFFLLFGTLMLRLFGVPLSMVRVVGGIILTRIGFQMFAPPPQEKLVHGPGSGPGDKEEDVAFIPLAMPIMFGPGAIATIIGMASTVKQSAAELESLLPSVWQSWRR